ncbi:MAG: trehalose-phosphatase [Thiomonas sp.]
MRPPPLPAAIAWFFDIDGTLVDIAATPDAVWVDPEVRALLARLHAAREPVALISGRPLGQIDTLFAPLRLPAAGVHGAERRDAAGRIQRVDVPALEPLAERLRALAQRLSPALRSRSSRRRSRFTPVRRHSVGRSASS